jgi:hypothetical protein
VIAPDRRSSAGVAATLVTSLLAACGQAAPVPSGGAPSVAVLRKVADIPLMQQTVLAAPFLAAGVAKVAYDLIIFAAFRRSLEDDEGQ